MKLLFSILFSFLYSEEYSANFNAEELTSVVCVFTSLKKIILQYSLINVLYESAS
ncbi:MAG: hypothetical protein IIA48_03660 [Bacteroidetes bacterium]|nr:hypothetical protein [Bacteroidota bacterium]